VLRERCLDPAHEIAPVRLIVDVLELAPAALGKMPARWVLVMRARRESAIVQQSVTRHAERDMAAA
jgi:hypothetical protein